MQEKLDATIFHFNLQCFKKCYEGPQYSFFQSFSTFLYFTFPHTKLVRIYQKGSKEIIIPSISMFCVSPTYLLHLNKSISLKSVQPNFT